MYSPLASIYPKDYSYPSYTTIEVWLNIIALLDLNSLVPLISISPTSTDVSILVDSGLIYYYIDIKFINTIGITLYNIPLL